jgi:hypothetical protein
MVYINIVKKMNLSPRQARFDGYKVTIYYLLYIPVWRRGYNWSTLFLADINTGTWSHVGGVLDETVKYGGELCETSTQE